MNKALFVHSNIKILNRLSEESRQKDLFTSSLVNALKWVTNPEIQLSGIFISPDDSTYSAFRFLEIALLHRPAVPIFLFEPELVSKPENSQAILKNIHVSGVFSGNESYQSLIKNLPAQVDIESETRANLERAEQSPDFTPVPISDFFSATEYTHDAYIFQTVQRPQLFAKAKTKVDPIFLTSTAIEHEFLYFLKTDLTERQQKLEKVTRGYLDEPISQNWKTSEVMAKAKQTLDEFRMGGVTGPLLDYTHEMLGDLFKLISKIDADEGSISTMIEKAKKCDRSMLCASYSIFVGKQMRFEKTATLEILGLASVLQDISIYNTPHGDISELPLDAMNEEQKQLYHQHPKKSADLVAHHTDVPQVTLQVIRQHHERKDMSGFPNRVGGSQLHPMAEILSLINSYYDLSKKIAEDEELIVELSKSVFPHYSEMVVMAFKAVLGKILKDKIKSHTRL